MSRIIINIKDDTDQLSAICAVELVMGLGRISEHKRPGSYHTGFKNGVVVSIDLRKSGTDVFHVWTEASE